MSASCVFNKWSIRKWILNPEDGTDGLSRNVGKQLPLLTV